VGVKIAARREVAARFLRRLNVTRKIFDFSNFGAGWAKKFCSTMRDCAACVRKKIFDF